MGINRVAVKDSSVLIDLANGELIGRWGALGIETYVTDSVLNELESCSQAQVIQSFVDAELIKVHSMAEKDALEWLVQVRRRMDAFGISFADAASLFCAQQKEAVLLTGDRVLRAAAEKSGTHVRGTLWVVDLLLWRGVIGFEEAIRSLEVIRSEGARLPSKECDLRIQKWRMDEKMEPHWPVLASTGSADKP